jgi:hypothetical protein
VSPLVCRRLALGRWVGPEFHTAPRSGCRTLALWRTRPVCVTPLWPRRARLPIHPHSACCQFFCAFCTASYIIRLVLMICGQVCESLTDLGSGWNGAINSRLRATSPYPLLFTQHGGCRMQLCFSGDKSRPNQSYRLGRRGSRHLSHTYTYTRLEPRVMSMSCRVDGRLGNPRKQATLHRSSRVLRHCHPIPTPHNLVRQDLRCPCATQGVTLAQGRGSTMSGPLRPALRGPSGRGSPDCCSK